MPFLNGYNHLVWRDGEPIDPFVLAVLGPDGTAVWQREIFNEGKRLMEMSPLQRLYSSRGPCGLDTEPSQHPAMGARVARRAGTGAAREPEVPDLVPASSAPACSPAR